MRSSVTFVEQFKQLDQLLTISRQYWQILPFELLELPWSENSALSTFLEQLSDDDIEHLDGNDQALYAALSPLLSLPVNFLESLPLNYESLPNIPARFIAGIKGKKWAQIDKFAATIPVRKLPILEWCAGKGHLGRAISLVQQREVTSVEWQQELCVQGQALADKHNVDQHFVQADVFDSQQPTLLRDEQHAVALHACGDLHVELMQQACSSGTQYITIAPCCYHLVLQDRYRPLSQLGCASSLTLSKQDLRLSIAQTVVATKRERKHRATEVAWRLGFDLLQRQINKTDSYLPLPSIKQSLLTGSFGDFCRWACDVKSLVLPMVIDVEEFEALGWQRRKTNAKIELVTHAFRAMLERWLLLDRVLFLVERGYEVQLTEFCDKKITPRNAMIAARYSVLNPKRRN